MSYLVVIHISISALPISSVIDSLDRTAIRGNNLKVAGIETNLLRTNLIDEVIVTERIAVNIGIANLPRSIITISLFDDEVHSVGVRPITLQHDGISSSRGIAANILISGRDDDPRILLAIVEHIAFCIGYHLVLGRNIRYKSPVILVAYMLVYTRLDIESFAFYLVILLPHIRGSGCTVIC